jgi:hypothetical protein
LDPATILEARSELADLEGVTRIDPREPHGRPVDARPGVGRPIGVPEKIDDPEAARRSDQGAMVVGHAGIDQPNAAIGSRSDECDHFLHAPMNLYLMEIEYQTHLVRRL